ncbi:hypothetical protein LH991_08730 [Schleiferilactobacillus harbinensis]|nr:hypothetical protein [Schleiferilactobacillus harbinensis]QFR64052.1 hypothetical protein LH991_08730 [Schleiferilactobacillus harbinensis]
MKLTIEASTTELQKMLQAIAGSQEHKEGFQPSDSESIIMPLSSEGAKNARDKLSGAVRALNELSEHFSAPVLHGHSKISADMSTNVTLDVTDLTSLLHQAITQAKQLQTTMNQVNELMKGQFGGAPIPQLPSRS